MNAQIRDRLTLIKTGVTRYRAHDRRWRAVMLWKHFQWLIRFCEKNSPGREQSAYDALQAALVQLRNELDCRIEHGAESNGHLEYARKRIDTILSTVDT